MLHSLVDTLLVASQQKVGAMWKGKSVQLSANALMGAGVRLGAWFMLTAKRLGLL